MRIKLKIMPGLYSVARMHAGSVLPEWASEGKGFCSITRTDEELSIVCDQVLIPATVKAERDWRGFKIQGPIPFEMTGVLASIIDPLGQAGISIFAISTFDTDYVLVKDENFQRAKSILKDSADIIE